jgi:hypothetical protein
MIRPANRRRLLAHTAVATAVALLTTACSSGPDTADKPSTGTRAESVVSARLTRTLPDDPVRMVLPVSGAETRWTQGLGVFGQQVARTAEASCGRETGSRPREQDPLAFIPFSDIPDLDFLARHGFGQSAEVPRSALAAASPAAGRPSGSGRSDAPSRCRGEGATAGRAVFESYAPLQEQWFRELTSLRRDPATLRALDTLPGCLAGFGHRVRDEDGFLGLVDSRLLNASTAEFPRVARDLGRAYATCMRPVEAVREPARLRLRDRFIAEHADDVRELRRTLVPSLRRAEKEYGARLVFPEP